MPEGFPPHYQSFSYMMLGIVSLFHTFICELSH